MLELVLTRVCTSLKGTFGVLSLNDIPLCNTCEDPWNDNKPNISCIPQGIYDCIHHDGARFTNVWEILDVPDRSAILIHSGNNIANTSGCVLVGNGFGEINGLPSVLRSIETLNVLRKLLPIEFILTVRGV